MWKKNNDWFGLAIGATLPLLAYMAVEGLIAQGTVSRAFAMIICIGTNLIPFYVFNNLKMEKTARGIVLVTIVYAVMFVFYKNTVEGTWFD